MTPESDTADEPLIPMDLPPSDEMPDPGPMENESGGPGGDPGQIDPNEGPVVPPEMEFGIHNSYTLAHMANAVYTGADGKDGTTIKKEEVTAALPQKLRDAGWAAEEVVSDGNTGFHAARFRNTESGEYVLAFAGTQPLSKADWVTNFKQGLGFKAEQYETAMQMALNLKQNLGEDASARLRFAGHSLGGGLASAAALATGIEAVTFNAAGIHKNTKMPDGKALDLTMADSLITAYRVCENVPLLKVYLDPLSLLQAGKRPDGLFGNIPDFFKLLTGNTGNTKPIYLKPFSKNRTFPHGMAAVLEAGNWNH